MFIFVMYPAVTIGHFILICQIVRSYTHTFAKILVSIIDFLYNHISGTDSIKMMDEQETERNY